MVEKGSLTNRKMEETRTHTCVSEDVYKERNPLKLKIG